MFMKWIRAEWGSVLRPGGYFWTWKWSPRSYPNPELHTGPKRSGLQWQTETKTLNEAETKSVNAVIALRQLDLMLISRRARKAELVK